MYIFRSKTPEDRLQETVKLIRQADQQAGEKVDQWLGSAPPYEVKRISEKIHIGTKGNKIQRAYRRAIIVMRAGILRHEINKVVGEVKKIADNDCRTRFDMMLQTCVVYTPVVPKALDLMAYKSNMQLQAGQMARIQQRLPSLRLVGRRGLTQEIYLPIDDPK